MSDNIPSSASRLSESFKQLSGSQAPLHLSGLYYCLVSDDDDDDDDDKGDDGDDDDNHHQVGRPPHFSLVLDTTSPMARVWPHLRRAVFR